MILAAIAAAHDTGISRKRADEMLTAILSKTGEAWPEGFM